MATTAPLVAVVVALAAAIELFALAAREIEPLQASPTDALGLIWGTHAKTSHTVFFVWKLA